MKRDIIVGKLIAEGLSEKTLVKLNDKQLLSLAERMLGEQNVSVGVKISKKDPQYQQKVADAEKQGKTIETYEEESKPSSGLSKEKKSEIVKKAKKGEDIGKKGKGFEKIVSKAKANGAKNPEAVAGAVMWKNVKRESVEVGENVTKGHNGIPEFMDSKKLKENEVKSWVKGLVENEKFHSFTSKNEIMELIQVKLNENKPSPSKPDTDAPVREKPTTKPGKPKRENPFEPKHAPKPKALGEEDGQKNKMPEFMKFKNLGFKFKDQN